MTVSSFAMVWDVWIVGVRGGELMRRNKLLISHTDEVYMVGILKANILKKFQTHTKWDSKLVNQVWFGNFKYRANSLLVPKPMASPADKMAQFLKKPWTLFPHNPIICQKTENKKKALPARKANYNQYRANTLLQTEGASLCIFGRRETKAAAYHCSNSQGKHFKQIPRWISSWCNHLLSHFSFSLKESLQHLRKRVHGHKNTKNFYTSIKKRI